MFISLQCDINKGPESWFIQKGFFSLFFYMFYTALH
uniref:Uncharacterized protein n=1 Tax=Anguilla anguilla TaxID=7936 RepID=A0A0E9SG00_ANGAN